MRSTTLHTAIAGRRTVREFSSSSVSRAAIDHLIWAAQGKTDENGNRTAPSAHGLHPLQLYITVGNAEDTPMGFYTIDREDGSLNIISKRDIRSDLRKAAIEDQDWITNAACIISICADFVTPSKSFADQKPYGRRGARYVYIEAGAAAQNVLLQAVEEGLGAVLVAGFSDEKTADILCLKAPIEPILHICVGVPK